jgi:hypothetical protein
MSAKSRYIKAAKQLAYWRELKKAYDSNSNAFVRSISASDYIDQLVKEGAIAPPPSEKTIMDWWNSFDSKNSKDYYNNPQSKWMNQALKKIKSFGVTSDSDTPSYDTKRGVFVNLSKGSVENLIRRRYTPSLSGWLASTKNTKTGKPIIGNRSELTYDQIFNNNNSTYPLLGGNAGFNSSGGLQADGQYKSLWRDLPSGARGAIRFVAETREAAKASAKKHWETSLANALNVWGSAKNYKPVKQWSFFGNGKLLTQAEARKDWRYKQKPEDLGASFEEHWEANRDKRDRIEWQDNRARLGLGYNRPAIKGESRTFPGNGKPKWSHTEKNQYVAKSMMPKMDTLEQYRKARDSGEIYKVDRYIAMASSNSALFDRKTGKIRDGVDIGFKDFKEYDALTEDQFQRVEERIAFYNHYYKAVDLEKRTRDTYKDDAKTRGRQKALGSLAIGALTGGIFSLGGLSASLSTATNGALAASTITSGVVGATAGGLQGGLEGAIKGGLTAGLGAAAGNAIGDYLGNLGDTGLVNGGLPVPSTGEFGSISGTGGSASANYVNGLIKAGLPVTDGLSAFSGTLSSSGSSLADKLGKVGGDALTDQLESQLNSKQSDSQPTPSNTQQPSESSSAIYIPKVRRGGIFGDQVARGTSFGTSAPSKLPTYNTGINLNHSNGNGFGLLNQQQKRI